MRDSVDVMPWLALASEGVMDAAQALAAQALTGTTVPHVTDEVVADAASSPARPPPQFADDGDLQVTPVNTPKRAVANAQTSPAREESHEAGAQTDAPSVTHGSTQVTPVTTPKRAVANAQTSPVRGDSHEAGAQTDAPEALVAATQTAVPVVTHSSTQTSARTPGVDVLVQATPEAPRVTVAEVQTDDMPDAVDVTAAVAERESEVRVYLSSCIVTSEMSEFEQRLICDAQPNYMPVCQQ
jgi:hypothetical protein